MTRQPKSVPDARPFLKWAGGKTQLLEEFSHRFPTALKAGKVRKYVEPFVGGGAVFFYVNQRFAFEESVICDANEELILTYRVVQRSVQNLIRKLKRLESGYLSEDATGREAFYYAVRDRFNRKKPSINFSTYQSAWVQRAAEVIFLNRTCYNGLFRMNRKGEFNVPFGRYACPDILNEDNLADAATLLSDARILLGDFSLCRPFADRSAFVYLDPPYRPLTRTASFTSYAKEGFSDEDQKRLAGFFRELDKAGAWLMLSNSDPKNADISDRFFERLYAGYRIANVPARRMINCNGARRGAIRELIITNYKPSRA